eukprot:7506968-Pyramimonas_sp.AAC.1
MTNIFPGVDTTGILIIPTCQNSAVDLVRVGEEVETEKDRLLERVRSKAQHGVGKRSKLYHVH